MNHLLLMHKTALLILWCCLRGCRYTKDIPQYGSASGTDGKPVIFPYIDLNIQTLQGNGQIRSSVSAAPGAYGQAGAAGSAGMASHPSVTPGRPGMTGAGRMPGGMAAERDVMVTRLSAAFTRIASQNAMERVSLHAYMRCMTPTALPNTHSYACMSGMAIQMPAHVSCNCCVVSILFCAAAPGHKGALCHQ